MSIKKLTKREYEILDKMVQGKNNIEISEELSISKSTVKIHCRSIFEKLEVNNRVKAVVKAITYGIIWI